MSDFDKEAERERLREKFEEEEEKREVTERMSELLLQGATMTNAHCSECGDPIFRYDGQEFCATCEKPVERGEGGAESGAGEGQDVETADAASAEEGDGEATESGQGEDRIEVTAPRDDARVQFGAAEGDEAAGERPREDVGSEASGEDQEPVAHRHRTVGDAARASRGRDPTEGEAAATEGEPAAGDRSEGRGRPAGGAALSSGSPRPMGSPGVDRARGALRRTLTRLSQQAEATEDPREAEAYLSAAREAAETLAALRH